MGSTYFLILSLNVSSFTASLVRCFSFGFVPDLLCELAELAEDRSLVLVFVQHLCTVFLEGRRDGVLRLIGFENSR